jgi:hypothetical protein
MLIDLMKQITPKIRDIGSQISVDNHIYIMNSIEIIFIHIDEEIIDHIINYSTIPKSFKSTLNPLRNQRNGMITIENQEQFKYHSYDHSFDIRDRRDTYYKRKYQREISAARGNSER